MYCDGGDSCCGTDGYRCKEDEGDCDQDSDCEVSFFLSFSLKREKKRPLDVLLRHLLGINVFLLIQAMF